jgi:hypothetical protein
MNFPSSNNTLCLGTLPTNTTSCFCYVSRHVDPPATVDTYKYWSCVVARPHSLLLPFYSTDRTNMSTTTTFTAYTNGRSVAWITGRFGHADHFEQQLKRVCQRVRDLNVFAPQDIYCYWQSPDYVLQQHAKFHRHLQYRNDPNDLSTKGGGFWFHKSLICTTRATFWYIPILIEWTCFNWARYMPLSKPSPNDVMTCQLVNGIGWQRSPSDLYQRRCVDSIQR